MSYLGCRSQYPMDTAKVNFLRERYSAETTAALKSVYGASPEYPRASPTLPTIKPYNAMEYSPRSVVAKNTPFVPPVEPLPDLPARALRMQTSSQWGFRPYGEESRRIFAVNHTHGKPSNKMTEYREQVFQKWNIIGKQ